jgi:hypothetical protein
MVYVVGTSTPILFLFLCNILLYVLWEGYQDFLRDFNRRKEEDTLGSLYNALDEKNACNTLYVRSSTGLRVCRILLEGRNLSEWPAILPYARKDRNESFCG